MSINNYPVWQRTSENKVHRNCLLFGLASVFARICHWSTLYDLLEISLWMQCVAKGIFSEHFCHLVERNAKGHNWHQYVCQLFWMTNVHLFHPQLTSNLCLLHVCRKSVCPCLSAHHHPVCPTLQITPPITRYFSADKFVCYHHAL